jgi:ubiquinol-cytochrome c reductase cytochrome b subunit
MKFEQLPSSRIAFKKGAQSGLFLEKGKRKYVDFWPLSTGYIVQSPLFLLFLACSYMAFASSGSQQARGAAIFEDSGCRHCHSIGDVGGHKGPDLSSVGRRRSKAAMRRQIVHGGRGMPAFGDSLAHDQISDLVAYLRSCRQLSAKESPTPNAN